MTEKKFFQMRMPHAFAVLMLLLFSFLSIVPGTKVQAEAAAQSTMANPAHTFTTTNDTTISTKANPGETTVLIFGHTSCGYTRSTLNSISSCDWVKRPDIRVIFAEINGHTKEEVQTYEQGYQCPDMTFCYDEDFGIQSAMADYAALYGVTRMSLPAIVFIDKDNNVQNLLTGQKTADEILNEIKKFENIDAGGSITPPAGSDTGIENFAYGLKSIDNTIVSTKSNPGETTVLIWGYTTCGNTKATLQDIDSSSWVSRSDIRVIYADVYGASLSETAEFAQTYSGKDIIFCHDESALNYKFALSYLGLYNHTGGTFPYIVLIDKNNKVRSITLGPKTADEIIKEIEKFASNEQKPGDNQSPGENQTPGGNQNPSPSVPNVSDVTGLKAVSSAKNVTLTWNKISNAAGYTIYQYNDSRKAWISKATLNTNTSAYTIKGLTPGTAYRFAVKAFIPNQNKELVYSKSYASLDTATAPNAVKFKVKSGKKKATIKWSKVKGATGYTVYYKTKTKGSWKKLKNVKGTSYTKTKLKSKATYFFTVKAYKKYKGVTYTSSFSSKKVKIK
ncbi:MAG: fibronectin type III domain-containing protein [Lachnospiraceae bacterium]|nr:fibronectin type III domain-containing protein [Lachnospiraceae bacterium]